MKTLIEQTETLLDKETGETNGEAETLRVPELKSLAEVLETTREELRSLTGLRLSTTIGTARSDKGWLITVELVERASVPDSMDLLATYEVHVDREGHVIEFKRKGLRKRLDSEERKEI